MQATDIALHLAAKVATDSFRRARERAISSEVASLSRFKTAMIDIHAVIQDESLDALALREKIRTVLTGLDPKLYQERPEATRDKLIEKPKRIRALMKNLMKLDIRGESNTLGTQGLELLRDLYGRNRMVLAPGDKYPCRRSWNELVNKAEDPAKRMHAFEASVFLEIQREFKRGSLFIPHSETYREQDEILIPGELWDKQRERHYLALGLPSNPKDYLAPQLERLQVGLNKLAKVVEDGDLRIEGNSLIAPRLEKHHPPEGINEASATIAAEIGNVQLPELLLEMDADTRFSWALLGGRPPRSDQELLECYGALLAHGTDLHASGVAMMIPGLKADQISAVMREIEAAEVLRAANESVTQFTLRHPISKHWGTGNWASSDMMSLEASRHLYSARRDPRLNTPAIGIYTHVLDRNVISYDQIIVLQTRQAGHAWEGALRQTDADLSHLAVDTHGYTLFVMGLAKHTRLDLCPRLADMGALRLFVPAGIAVPEILAPVVVPLSLKIYEEQYDQVVRVAASVADGTTNAVVAARRFGTAATGNQVHSAGVAFGKLQRTNFLCDVYTNPPFRSEYHRCLNQGEAMHQLQHAIHAGKVSHDRGRRMEELKAISGSLTLLSNLVVAWSTKHTQMAVDRLASQGQVIRAEQLRHISPVRFGNINFRGVFSFPLDQYRARIIAPGTKVSRIDHAS